MENSAQGPYADRNDIAAFDSDPVDEFSREETAHGVEDAEETGHGTIFSIGPVEFRLDEFFVSEGQDLTVQIVDGRGEEK